MSQLTSEAGVFSLPYSFSGPSEWAACCGLFHASGEFCLITEGVPPPRARRTRLAQAPP